VLSGALRRHFARAAVACNVHFQPTLAAGIKQIEEGLGVYHLERPSTDSGFYPWKVSRVLAWAQRVLRRDYGGLTQELSELREGLAGQMRIGAIRSVWQDWHADRTVWVETLEDYVPDTSPTSIELSASWIDFTIDVGLTYLNNEPCRGFARGAGAVSERYCDHP